MNSESIILPWLASLKMSKTISPFDFDQKGFNNIHMNVEQTIEINGKIFEICIDECPYNPRNFDTCTHIYCEHSDRWQLGDMMPYNTDKYYNTIQELYNKHCFGMKEEPMEQIEEMLEPHDDLYVCLLTIAGDGAAPQLIPDFNRKFSLNDPRIVGIACIEDDPNNDKELLRSHSKEGLEYVHKIIFEELEEYNAYLAKEVYIIWCGEDLIYSNIYGKTQLQACINDLPQWAGLNKSNENEIKKIEDNLSIEVKEIYNNFKSIVNQSNNKSNCYDAFKAVEQVIFYQKVNNMRLINVCADPLLIYNNHSAEIDKIKISKIENNKIYTKDYYIKEEPININDIVLGELLLLVDNIEDWFKPED